MFGLSVEQDLGWKWDDAGTGLVKEVKKIKIKVTLTQILHKKAGLLK